MAYCTTKQLLVGNIPLPRLVDPNSYVNDASDEIDSMIGFRYITPVVPYAEANPQPAVPYVLARPVLLLLKRINVWLATGRMILAIDSAGEDTQLHAYGLKLVSDAMTTLVDIRDGKINLDGTPEIIPDTPDNHRGPAIFNGDVSSAVDDFYGPNGPMGPNLSGTRINLVPGIQNESETIPGLFR